MESLSGTSFRENDRAACTRSDAFLDSPSITLSVQGHEFLLGILLLGIREEPKRNARLHALLRGMPTRIDQPRWSLTRFPKRITRCVVWVGHRLLGTDGLNPIVEQAFHLLDSQRFG